MLYRKKSEDIKKWLKESRKSLLVTGARQVGKTFLIENQVLVNGSRDDRRGRKLFDGDVVSVFDQQYLIKVIEE